MPSSAVMVAATSSARDLSPSASFFNQAARCATGVAAQLSKALRAALTAAATSCSVPAGTVAMVSSVAGLITGKVSSPRAAIHCPSIYNLSRTSIFCPPYF